MSLQRIRSSIFDYAAKLALDHAALAHREAGRMCQCGHLMHAGTCGDRNPIQSTPTAYAAAFCRCAAAKLMGEPGSCMTRSCIRPTQVIDGIATITCEPCQRKREESIARIMAEADARRRKKAWRGLI